MWSRDTHEKTRAAGGAGSRPGLELAFGLGRNMQAGFVRFALILAIAGAVAGCFQPLYGERSVTGGPGIREAMSSIDVVQIAAPDGTSLSRLAVEVRNELVFGLTGGAGTNSPTHRLTIRLLPNTNAVIVDPTTQRAEYVNYGLDAQYSLVELATGKTVVNSNAATRVTYNAPGQEQRFALARGLRDAETRAAKIIADQIRTRLASYFAAGT
jgi:LPS-assembly lipoprotein